MARGTGSGPGAAVSGQSALRAVRVPGQLRPLVVERVKPGAFERYLAWCSHKGMRVGNVKPKLLCAEASVPEVLRGTHLLSQGSLIP